ncbi:hypothetical protein, partial [Millionella massiliensis]|uniref:hypothetical protein n=1 Tax=Millionella massiliensis TaxID=1871023 RepID=UPI0023A7AA75
MLREIVYWSYLLFRKLARSKQQIGLKSDTALFVAICLLLNIFSVLRIVGHYTPFHWFQLLTITTKADRKSWACASQLLLSFAGIVLARYLKAPRLTWMLEKVHRPNSMRPPK